MMLGSLVCFDYISNYASFFAFEPNVSDEVTTLEMTKSQPRVKRICLPSILSNNKIELKRFVRLTICQKNYNPF